MFISRPTYLSMDYILSKVSQEEIFERYSGIPVVLNRMFRSPFRIDKKPSCKYYVKNGNIRMHDKGGHFHGNCFDYVQKMYNCSFTDALKLIESDFRLNTVITRTPKYTVDYTENRASITVRWRPFNANDVVYWESYGITTDWLAYYNVGAISEAYVNGKLVYTYNHNDPGYGYWFDGEFKLYFPLRSEYRFLNNYTGLQGYDQLPETGDLLIITKSYKDVILLRTLGYYAVAPSSETVLISQDQYDDLSSRFKRIVSFYDFDYAGVKGANKLKKQYGIKYIFLTNGRFRTSNYGAKDLTDLYKNRGGLRSVCSYLSSCLS